MTKEEVKNIVKRYNYVSRAIDSGSGQAVFYVGKRRQVINITDEVMYVRCIIEIVYRREDDNILKLMIKNILSGEKDVFTMQKIYCSKSAFYSKKREFFEKVYECCISIGLINFMEILA